VINEFEDFALLFQREEGPESAIRALSRKFPARDCVSVVAAAEDAQQAALKRRVDLIDRYRDQAAAVGVPKVFETDEDSHGTDGQKQNVLECIASFIANEPANGTGEAVEYDPRLHIHDRAGSMKRRQLEEFGRFRFGFAFPISSSLMLTKHPPQTCRT